MSEKGDSKITILLNGGLADRKAPELRAPLAQPLGSPALARSDNTRFSPVVGTAVRAPNSAVAGSAVPTVCHGIAVAGFGDSALVMGRDSANVLYGMATTRKNRIRQSSNLGIGHLPGHVTRGGSTGLDFTDAYPCVQVDEATGRVWRANYGSSPSTRVSLSITASDGTTVMPPRWSPFNLLANSARWVSLTAHGANVMCLWYVVTSGGSQGLRVVRLTYSDGTGELTASADTLVILPTSFAGVWYDVQRFDDTFAIVITGHPATAANTRVIKLNVGTFASTTADFANVGTAFEHAARVFTHGGNTRVAIVIGSTTSVNYSVYLLDSALATIWGPIAIALPAAASRIAIGASQWQAATASVNVVATYSTGALSAGPGVGHTGSVISQHAITTGASGSGAISLPWKILENKGCHLTWSATDFATAFFLTTAFSALSTTPADVDYVDDPSLECFFDMPQSTNNTVPRARVGCVRGSFAPYDSSDVSDRMSSSGCAASGSSLLVDYRTTTRRDNGSGLNSFICNSATIDFAARVLLSVSDRDGLSVSAASIPLAWDGCEFSGFGDPLYRPHIFVASTGGTPAYPAGTYSFVAFYSWRDQTGQKHRSRPSNVVAFAAPGGSAVVVSAADPLAFTLKQSLNFTRIALEVYCTPLNNPSFVFVGASERAGPGTGWREAVQVALPVTSSPVIYSTGAFGQELLPQPPPPLRDVAIVGPRMWGIDAEFPSRIVQSKLRVAGIGYEFNPALESIVPATGGEAVRVFEVSGTAVVLCERAVWQFSGFGPDNTGNGGSFSSPIKLSDYGCSDAYSACAFPGGLIWAAKDRWYVMTGGSVQQIESVRVGMTITHAIHFKDQDEIAFYGTQTTFDPGDTFGPAIAKVYNYATGKWSRWNALAYTQLAATPNDARRAIGFLNGTLYKIDAETYANNASMVFETDWMSLAGDPQDHIVVRDVILNAERIGAHGVTVEVLTDYNLTATTSRSYNDAAIQGFIAAGSSSPRYSLRVEPVQQETRALKVRITFTVTGTAEGGRPISLTLCYRAFAPLREESFVAGSYT